MRKQSQDQVAEGVGLQKQGQNFQKDLPENDGFVGLALRGPAP